VESEPGSWVRTPAGAEMHRFLTFMEGEGECQVPRGRVWCSSRKGSVAIPRVQPAPRSLPEGEEADPVYKRAHRPSVTCGF
jgi:hypothetical protein